MFYSTFLNKILLSLLVGTTVDDLLNIDNLYFKHMVCQLYPTELQLHKANFSDTEAPFLDLDYHLL